MKYWRGYLTAAILAFFTYALMEFAKTHGVLIDMVYPYVTRMIQDVLAQWSSSVSFCLWQVVAALAALLLLASVVLMIIFRWNPIQWFGWVLAAASLVFFLHTGIYGLNTYSGPIADDVRLTTTEYSLGDLKKAAAYYRDQANSLAGRVKRDSQGKPIYPDFDQLALQAEAGFQALTYEKSYSIFAGNMLPVKELGFADLYTSMGIAGFTMPLTGEAAVNPQIPPVSLPFTMCHEMSHRMSIAVERDANFAAFLACRANPSVEYQYSAQFMAYLYCYNALYAANPTAAQEVSAKVGDKLYQDMADYREFFASRQNKKATEFASSVNDTYIKTSGDEEGVASYGDVCDLLVSLYIQEIVVPSQVVEEPDFDPLDPEQVDVSDLIATR